MWKEIISLAIVVVTILIIYSSGYSAGLREGIKIGKDNSFKKVAKEALDLAKEALDLAKSAIETSEELQKENERLRTQLHELRIEQQKQDN